MTPPHQSQLPRRSFGSLGRSWYVDISQYNVYLLRYYIRLSLQQCHAARADARTYDVVRVRVRSFSDLTLTREHKYVRVIHVKSLLLWAFRMFRTHTTHTHIIYICILYYIYIYIYMCVLCNFNCVDRRFVTTLRFVNGLNIILIVT